MDDKIKEVITEHSEIIDMYVKQLDDIHTDIKMKYTSLIRGCIFRANSGFLTSVDKIYMDMFYTIDRFINNVLPIHLTLDYIKYYEKTLNKPWKQLYLNSTDVKIHTDDPTIEEITDMFGTTKWWESELKEFK